MSLLPVIRVTEILQETVVGGTTRPMLVVGEDGRKYILKIFSKKDAAQRSYTVAEVISSLLAREFDLFVPEAVYMTIDPELIKSLEYTQPKIFQKLQEKEVEKLLFGSLYHEGLPIYSPAINDRLLELDEFESVFAFDMLIANDDRRAIKPNILRGRNHYLLIDHEKAFEGLEVTLANYQKGIVPHHFSNHIFYTRLKKEARKKLNTVNFETFKEYFRILTFNKIEENIHFLVDNGYNADECYSWLKYLQTQKENYNTFVSLLIQKISE